MSTIQCFSTQALSAPAGLSWAATTIPLGDWRGPVWNGSVFCAVGYNSNKVVTSTDGVNWVSSILQSSSIWNSLIWSGVRFIALAPSNTKITYSVDGVNWTAAANLPSYPFTGLCSNGSRVFAIPANTGRLYYSDDHGSSWGYFTIPANSWRSVAAAGTTVVCCAADGSLWLSTNNGSTGALITPPTASGINKPFVNMHSVIHNGTEFCLSATEELLAYDEGEEYWYVTGYTTLFATSTDGMTWVSKTEFLNGSINLRDYPNPRITYGNGMYVLLGSNFSGSVISGNNWSALSTVATPAVGYSGVAYSSTLNKFVAVGSNKAMIGTPS